MTKIILVAGARPNFMKIAPIWEEMTRCPDKFDPIIVHTGQHYDYEMSEVFFKDLELPAPDIYLGVGSGTHAEQSAKIMLEFERILGREEPDIVIVVGDVNSTLACAITTVKYRCARLSINHPLLCHVESGLRSFDPVMPEEINRKLTDHVSDILFTTSRFANENLEKESISEEKIIFVGDIMMDPLFKYKEMAQKSKILQELGLISPHLHAPMSARSHASYCLLTLHRPENVDNPENLKAIMRAIAEIATKIPVIFPIHPRTRKNLKQFKLLNYKVTKLPNNLKLIDPLGYLDFLKLMMNSRFVLTDSGSIQGETTALNIPCLTLRENTERMITVMEGTNIICGIDSDRIIEECDKILNGNGKKGKIPKLWDGKTARRIVNHLIQIAKVDE
ncbi:MAG TPA: UDP-N-acetylglucosamine 2-epimerase (non-hydrolyzing) [bacterium (Candidatus Stahlbacteria)]|nr:UDP-N-acetylglucosamine 2-epimerase (non-hydrolyzing) [Candidatus Stahlbacteria bacterium]